MSAETSVDLLRRAAAQIRVRANTATGVGHHWSAVSPGVGVGMVMCGQVRIASTDETLGGGAANARHIAAWHPAVALVVADWLEADATVIENNGLDVTISKAYDVARAYLGEVK